MRNELKSDNLLKKSCKPGNLIYNVKELLECVDKEFLFTSDGSLHIGKNVI